MMHEATALGYQTGIVRWLSVESTTSARMASPTIDQQEHKQDEGRNLFSF
jgi:hypothetical protein